MECRRCGSVMDEVAFSCPVCGHAREVAPNSQTVPGSDLRGGEPNYRRPLMPPGQDHLVFAVLSTLCCCLFTGIPAIVYAAQARAMYRDGNIAGGERAARTAMNWIIASVVLALLGILLQLGLRTM